jgi:hypothetical protein
MANGKRKKTKTIYIPISVETYARLDGEAHKMRRSMAQQAALIIDEWYSQLDRDAAAACAIGGTVERAERDARR